MVWEPSSLYVFITSQISLLIFRNSVRSMASSEKADTWKEEKQMRLDQSIDERRKVGWISDKKLVKLLSFFRNIFVMKIL